MIVVVGVDPGLTGAISFFWPSDGRGAIAAEDIPVMNSEIDAALLAARIRSMQPVGAVIERVAARPGQGVSSMFRFGQAFGTIIGVLGAFQVPVHFVTPSKWKKAYGLGPDKEEARSKTIYLWPAADCFTRKRDHGRAESALLALYGAEVL